MSSEPAAPTSSKVRQAALIGGSALLVIGVSLIVLAAVRSAGGAPAEDAAINLTTAGSPTAAPLVIVSTRPAQAKATKKPTAAPSTATTAPPAPSTPAPTVTKPRATAKKPPPRVKPVANTGYQLRNVITGLCVGPMKDGAQLTQEACASGNQVRLEPTRSVSGVQLYRLREGGGANLCFDPPNFESEQSGTILSAFDCRNPSSGDNQEWHLEDSGKTSKGHAVYTVVNFKSGNCLNVINWAADKTDRAPGLALSIFTCSDPVWGYDDHYWTFN
jgi:hypothetical protein